MKKEIRILLIEDDADDIELLEESLKSNNVIYSMNAVMEGDKVASYLAATTDALPDVIVLDFNLPKLHGRDILAVIKNAEYYKNVPLVVLSTSASAEDIQFAESMGADHYITKPASIDEFNKTISIIVKAANRAATPEY